MKNCWDLKGCPASHYMNCPAYAKRRNCWEEKNGCLCKVYPICDDCPIFIKHKKDIEETENKG